MRLNLTIPETWNQLSPTQLQNIVYQIHCFQTIVKDNAQALSITSAKLYVQVAKEMLRGNKWFSVQRALKEIQPKEFFVWCKFLYDSVERTKFIPPLKIKGILYYPPGQRLRNISIGEFAFADSAYDQWRKTKKHIWLDVLCATLYREHTEGNPELDIRRPFIKQAVDVRADKFKTLSFKTKLTIAACYEGCRNHIERSYPTIFPAPPKTKEGEEQVTNPVKAKYVSFGKLVIMKIDGDPAKLEQTNSVLAYDFLNIMASDIEKARKMKRK